MLSVHRLNIDSTVRVLSMADTATPGSETTISEQASGLENFPVEGITDTIELDLGLEEELIIEDFTIDGICGVY